MKALALVFALVCSTAMADGVPLFTPGPALPSGVVMSIRAEKGNGPMTAVVVNRHAIDANIINVTVNGKVHTFVGQKKPPMKGVDPQFEFWSGKEGDVNKGGALLTLTYHRGIDQMLGRLTIWNVADYDLISRGGRSVFVLSDPTFHGKSLGMPSFEQRTGVKVP